MGLLDHTSPQAEAVMIGIYSRMPAWRKLQLVDDANRTTALLVMAGLRSRYPDDSLPRLRRRLLGLLLGEERACEVYGPLEASP